MRSTSNQKRLGTSFEHIAAQMAALSGFSVLRIPDGCRHLGRGRIIPIKSPFDYVLAKAGQVIFFDCKTYQKEYLNYSDLNLNQVGHLLQLERESCVAGYVVYFRLIDKISFFKASDLWKMKPREGLLPEQGVDLGKITTLNFNPLLELHGAASHRGERL